MTAIGAVVFDLDGTLVDSRLDIERAVSATLRAHGRPELELETVLGFVGDGSPRLIARVFGLPPSSPELAPYLQSAYSNPSFLSARSTLPVTHQPQRE
jgi:phosphoglycolate phosphatase